MGSSLRMMDEQAEHGIIGEVTTSTDVGVVQRPHPPAGLSGVLSLLGQRRRVPVVVRDGAIALLLAVASFSQPLGEHAQSWLLTPVTVPVVLAMTMPHAIRRVYPDYAWMISLTGAIVSYALVVEVLGPGVIATAVTLYSAAAYGRAGFAWCAAAFSVAAAIAGTVYELRQGALLTQAYVDLLLPALPLLAGISMRGQRARERLALDHADAVLRLRELDAASAVSEERLRITHELHDIVAHHVTGIVLQARAAERMLDHDPARARSAVAAVTDEAGQALQQLRDLVGALRLPDGHDRAPQPRVEDLPGLIERSRNLGATVTLDTDGIHTPLRPAAELTVYRVVQEALTNVVRHADPPVAHVTLTHSRGAIEVIVDDEGRAHRAGRAPDIPGGHGLIGMRERVEAWGGTFEAGPRENGGWRVRAVLPGVALGGTT